MSKIYDDFLKWCEDKWTKDAKLHHLFKKLNSDDISVLREYFIPIPDNPTNGDMVKSMFPEAKVEELRDCVIVFGGNFEYQHYYPKTFWDSPYRKEQE